jgi:hypothetical protein
MIARGEEVAYPRRDECPPSFVDPCFWALKSGPSPEGWLLSLDLAHDPGSARGRSPR